MQEKFSSAKNQDSALLEVHTGQAVPFREALWTWGRVALLSFGGPAGQIAVMHRILVEEKRWIGETRFLHALNYCMLLPGPEALELAIYIGWLLHRVRGGIVAGLLFVMPGAVALTALSWIYASFGETGLVQAVFLGLKAAVLAVVLDAVVRVGRRAIKSIGLLAIAVAAFVGIFFFAIPFPLIILSAAVVGYFANRMDLAWFKPSLGSSNRHDDDTAVIDAKLRKSTPAHIRPSVQKFIQVILIGGIIWLSPLFVLLYFYGPHNVFTAIALFNSKMAVVTFGGAYAVLAYMAQQAVEHYHWLMPNEMLVGLGLAETTPGPLISVVQFVGFMAGFRHAGVLGPTLAGLFGGFLAMWSTFVPPFIWIFLGGPYMETLLGHRSLNVALSAVTAAVVGVILNLAAWFALHALFERVDELHRLGFSLAIPVWSSVHVPMLFLSFAAAVAIFRFRIGMITTFAVSSLAGAIYFLVTTSI